MHCFKGSSNDMSNSKRASLMPQAKILYDDVGPPF